MSWTVERKELDGTMVIVGVADDPQEIGIIIDEDRDKIDYEALYRATPSE
jgi:hypothetical protein